MAKYFIKNFNWVIQKGLDGIELFNVEKSDILIRFNKEEAEIYEKIVRGTDIESIEKTEIFNYVLETIEKYNVGVFSNKYYINNEYKKGKDEIGYFDANAKLVNAYLELPSSCGLCDNCDKALSSPCFSCHSVTGKIIEVEKYYKIIEELRKYNCERIILHGGNILNEEILYKIVNKVLNMNMVVELITHYKMIEIINKNDIDKLVNAENKGKIKFVVNYDVMNLDDVEKIFECIQEIINKIPKEYCEFSIRIDKNMINVIRKLRKDIFNLGISVANVSVISDNIITECELEEIFQLPSIDYDTRKVLKKYNRCLAGIIAIDANLNVLPCPHIRQYKIFKDDGMINTDITLKQWWLMSNEKVEKCQNCSKRSRCMECRAIEIKMTGDIKGKRQCEYFQNYDLEEGK